MEKFIWCPRPGSVGGSKFRTHEAQFGDGYRQMAGDGINNRVQQWPLTFTGKSTYIASIKAFLDAHKGFLPFLWTPPLEGEGLYVAGEYTVTPLGARNFDLTVSFQQVFAP